MCRYLPFLDLLGFYSCQPNFFTANTTPLASGFNFLELAGHLLSQKFFFVRPMNFCEIRSSIKINQKEEESPVEETPFVF